MIHRYGSDQNAETECLPLAAQRVGCTPPPACAGRSRTCPGSQLCYRCNTSTKCKEFPFRTRIPARSEIWVEFGSKIHLNLLSLNYSKNTIE